MLEDYLWNMTGYIPKYPVNPHCDGIIPYVAERIFQLEPEPPVVDSLNEYILSALQEKDLRYFSFFLHHYEPQLNKRIKSFLGVDGGDLYDTDRFIDVKLSCREQMLQKLMDYDPAKGAEYATYIYPFIRDAMLRFRMGEEKWSVPSLTSYKMLRTMAWLYHNTKDAVNEFARKYNCDLALAEEYLKVVRGIRNQQPFYVTDEDGEETGEDVALDDTWNYADILWNGIQAEKVQRAFEKLNYREQTLLEKRLAICMTCGRVGSWKGRPTFEELAVMFEGSTANGAERAYRRAVDKLTELLVAEGALHAIRLKQKSKTKHKKKIAAAVYEYQADCDGEWGEISLDFESGTAKIIRLADWDTMKTNRFANKAIAYLLNCENEKLPKETILAFESKHIKQKKCCNFHHVRRNLQRFFYLRFSSIHLTAKSTRSRCFIRRIVPLPSDALWMGYAFSKAVPISSKSSPSTKSVSYRFQTRCPFSMTALCSILLCLPE